MKKQKPSDKWFLYNFKDSCMKRDVISRIIAAAITTTTTAAKQNKKQHMDRTRDNGGI